MFNDIRTKKQLYYAIDELKIISSKINSLNYHILIIKKNIITKNIENYFINKSKKYFRKL